MSQKLEKFSVIQALKAMDRAHVVLVVIDAEEGVTDQDITVAGYAYEKGRAVILVVNKWDKVEKNNATMRQYRITSYNLCYTKLLRQSADQFSLISHPDLAHFDAGVKLVGQVLDQFPEVDATIRCEIEDDLGAVKQIFSSDKLHFHFAIGDTRCTNAKRIFFPFGIGGGQGNVFVGGDPKDGLEFFGGLVLRNFPKRVHNGSESAPPVRFHDNA